MRRSIWGFAFATTLPAVLILVGAVLGGAWVWAGLFSITALVAGMDALFSPKDGRGMASQTAADRLSVALVGLHLAVLAAAILGVAGKTDLTGAERVALFIAAGLFMGQVSNSNAHELIHRAKKRLRRAGALVFTSHLFGHHTTAHPGVHHRYVATPMDPNTARKGESVYRFAWRAWTGSYRAGLTLESARLTQKGRRSYSFANPYWGYLGGGALFALGAFALAGPAGLAAYLGLALYATFQILLSDYVQHYGLWRAEKDGTYEPVGPQHSWNAPHWYSSLLMLNAPRHSDHHAHPTTPYPALDIPPGAPVLPRALPAMATLAMFPSVWRRVMDKRVDRLGSGN